MGTFSVDMSSYEIKHSDVMASDYSDEVLCVGWIPSLACHQPQPEKTALPANLAAVDVELFLRKMYACQR